VDVQNLQFVPYDLRAGREEEFACFAESKDFRDSRMMQHVEQKLLGKIGQGGFGAGGELLWLCAVAVLAVLEDHGGGWSLEIWCFYMARFA
jgi:hypothetical protein